MSGGTDTTATPDKVAVLAHYRREAAQLAAPERTEPTFATTDTVAQLTWCRQSIDPEKFTQAQVHHVVDVLLRQVLAVNAVFGPVYIDLGRSTRLVCTVETLPEPGARA